MMKIFPKLLLARCLCQLCFLVSMFIISLPLQAQESARNPFQAPPPTLTSISIVV